MRKKITAILLILFIPLLLISCQAKVGQEATAETDVSKNPEETKEECWGNIKGIAVDCELFAVDNNSKYPQTLKELKEAGYNKEKSFTCPGCNKEYKLETSENQEDYSITCEYHKIKFTPKNGLEEI